MYLPSAETHASLGNFGNFYFFLNFISWILSRCPHEDKFSQMPPDVQPSAISHRPLRVTQLLGESPRWASHKRPFFLTLRVSLPFHWQYGLKRCVFCRVTYLTQDAWREAFFLPQNTSKHNHIRKVGFLTGGKANVKTLNLYSAVCKIYKVRNLANHHGLYQFVPLGPYVGFFAFTILTAFRFTN